MIHKTFRFPPASRAIPNGITRVFVYDHATYFPDRELLASSARRFLPCNCNRFEYRTRILDYRPYEYALRNYASGVVVKFSHSVCYMYARAING